MPAPIEKVIWVPAEKLSMSQIREHRQQATALLDGHLEAAPRKSGSLQEAYVVSDFEHSEREIDRTEKLIVTIDLDYFARLTRSRPVVHAHSFRCAQRRIGHFRFRQNSRRASKRCVYAGSPNAARSLAQQRLYPMLQLDRAAHAGAD